MTKRSRTVVCVVGARPNYMKAAPIVAALRDSAALTPMLVHTGQHYDPDMNEKFFAELGMPAPQSNLGVGSGSHAVQTAEVMIRFEPVLDAAQDPILLVVGDVNSTIACALVAAKKGIPVIHVEAGLRSRDRAMPEEINRVLTDQISDLLFTTERSAAANLTAEGIDAARIHFVGNVMIDTLVANLPRAISPAETLAAAGLPVVDRFAVSTLHRPSNVDDPSVLGCLLDCLSEIGRDLPVILPLHPRTRARIESCGLSAKLDGKTILPLGPQGYLAMLGLMKNATLVLTDSGGIQEETTALGIPCLTLRDNTERPATVAFGTNTLVGRDPARILACAREALAGGGKAGRIPEFWDGHAARRIVSVLETAFT
ncbi:UDP-N-acetylglucosamine 2-epimerase (non-hydrolyzing) [Paramagnetospirillum kuznetsovii]|uniref:UDP-N-acetylglucosamine 2-epimerase (Non-hydrolyzing) n=1 Tax=Paramagnetospirillum kuznetsovii TaxID=2053833 RepID=A0A364P2P6_9PROT|nr:UDP-N-acetylglucosamine 2-epimerase (non-hydrolyzing) [Paramagnetospirillum kuznetsovii]RAU23622.1 UDP-N-acetylglucosamine 2-epimerase (non-hydrolyzing) [Paramagnetospirillum kuznetsovii]